MIRASFILFLFIIYLIVTFPLVLLGFLLGKFSPKLQYKIGQWVASIASNIFFILAGAKMQVTGLDNIPKKSKEAVLFIGNHKSYMDIPLMVKYVPFPLAFIAKASLKKVPFLSQIMSLLGCLFMVREDVRQSLEMIKAGIAKLKRGESLLIFPEGTRSKTDQLLPFKQGSLKLAEKSHVAIIPFALKGTEELFGNHGFKVIPSTVWLTFGTPIYLEQLSPEEQKKSAQYVQGIIQEMYNRMI